MSTNVIGFSELYQRYAPDVRRFALYLSGDPALADDIVSETFVRVWTTREKVRLETVKAYLFTIARNLYLHELRRARRNVSFEEATIDPAAGSQASAEHQTELFQVMELLRTLPEVDRTALLMRAQDGLSYEEIAGALGISLAAVKVKIHRARLKVLQARRTTEGALQ